MNNLPARSTKLQTFNPLRLVIESNSTMPVGTDFIFTYKFKFKNKQNFADGVLGFWGYPGLNYDFSKKLFYNHALI